MSDIKTIIYTAKQNTQIMCFEFYFMDGDYYRYEDTAGLFISKLLNDVRHYKPGTPVKTKWGKLVYAVFRQDFVTYLLITEEYMTNKVQTLSQQLSLSCISCEEKILLDTELTVLRVFTTFRDFFLDLFTKRILEQRSTIKICANCGNYFVPKRSDALYCDNVSPQDPLRTCKRYASTKTYQENLKTNDAMGLYRKIYMQKQMRAKRDPDNEFYQKDFEVFKTESKKWKKAILQGEVTEQEYIVWLRCTKEEVK